MPPNIMNGIEVNEKLPTLNEWFKFAMGTLFGVSSHKATKEQLNFVKSAAKVYLNTVKNLGRGLASAYGTLSFK